MSRNYALTMVRRSRLIMPVHQKKFVEKAHTRNADAITLDLEDSVPDSEKLAARGCVKEAIALAGKGGSEIIVRVNHTPELLEGDLESAIWPGISAIYLPKCETAAEVAHVEKILSRLENERGLPVGHTTINAVIETPRGYLNAEQVVASSDRIDSVTLGNEDFCADISLINSPETRNAMLTVRMHLLIVARAYNKIPMGLVDSMTGFKDTGGFEDLATLSAKHGFMGASCIHPGNVEALNKCFSPDPAAVAKARVMVAALDKAFAEGIAAIEMDGKMVDIVHYKKAAALIKRADLIDEFETRKRKAREAAQ